MTTRYTFHVTYRRPDNSTGAMSGTAKDLSGAIERATYEALYYKAQGYVPTIELTEVCERCEGSGKVPMARFRFKRCPECKGKEGPVNTVTFDLVVPESVEVRAA